MAWKEDGLKRQRIRSERVLKEDQLEETVKAHQSLAKNLRSNAIRTIGDDGQRERRGAVEPPGQASHVPIWKCPFYFRTGLFVCCQRSSTNWVSF